jgi:hypothetical protein
MPLNPSIIDDGRNPSVCIARACEVRAVRRSNSERLRARNCIVWNESPQLQYIRKKKHPLSKQIAAGKYAIVQSKTSGEGIDWENDRNMVTKDTRSGGLASPNVGRICQKLTRRVAPDLCSPLFRSPIRAHRSVPGDIQGGQLVVATDSSVQFQMPQLLPSNR